MNDNQYAVPSAPKQPTLYDQHAQAVAEFHAACRDYQDVSARKERAGAQLQKLTQVLAEAIAQSLQDPTIPQQPPANGQMYSAGIEMNPAGVQLRSSLG